MVKNKNSVSIPSGIKINIKESEVTRILATGPLGTVHLAVVQRVTFYLDNSLLKWEWPTVSKNQEKIKQMMLNNSFKKHFNNTFKRLRVPDECHFKIVGRGYRVTSSKTTRRLALELGFSGKKIIHLPASVNAKVLNRYEFILSSINSADLRALCNRIRQLRVPNVYTSKGIFLNGEKVRLKQGKKAQY